MPSSPKIFPSRYAAVLFDFDGTLLDTFPAIVKAWNAGFEPLLGRVASPDEVISHFGNPDEVMIDKALPAGTAQAERDKLIDRYFAAYHEAQREIVPFAGIPELLHDLREAKIPLALITGKGLRATEITLEYFGWREFFVSVITGDDFENQKPHPEGALHIAGLIGVEPVECALVGDSPADIGAAQNAGMASIVAGWHPYYADKLRPMHPDFWPRSPVELREILLGQRQTGENEAVQ